MGALLPLALALTSCATLINDRREKIPVRSEPAGAVVSVDCGNAPTYGGVTPATIIIERKAEPCTLTLGMPGYLDERIELHRELSRATTGNQAPGVVVGTLATVFSVLSGATRDPFGDAPAVFDAGKDLGSAPGNAIDRRTGAAYKHVPGEVYVELRPVTEPK